MASLASIAVALIKLGYKKTAAGTYTPPVTTTETVNRALVAADNNNSAYTPSAVTFTINSGTIGANFQYDGQGAGLVSFTAGDANVQIVDKRIPQAATPQFNVKYMFTSGSVLVFWVTGGTP